MNVALAYFAVVLIWATTPLAIQWSGHDSWFVGVAGRILISAILIIPILIWMTRVRFSFHWRDIKIYLAATLGMLGGMTPMYYAAQTMPSGWISLIFGLTPILTGVFAFVLLKNLQLTLSKYIGILVSFAGLSIIFIPKLNFAPDQQLLLGMSLAVLGASCHSLSTVLVKKLNHGLPNTHIVAAAVWLSSLIYLLVHPQYLYQLPQLSEKSFWAITYLGVFGSLVGFILYYYVLKRIDAIRLGLITLITPIMALFLGYFLNNEPLNSRILTGAGLVIFGLILFEFGHRISKENLKLLTSRTL